MIISNGMMRNLPDVDKTELKVKDEENIQAQTCENKVDVHKDSNDGLNTSQLLASLMNYWSAPMISNDDYKVLQECYYELDKKVAVLAAMVSHIKQ